MAQLKDTIVSGNLRITDTTLSTTVRASKYYGLLGPLSTDTRQASANIVNTETFYGISFMLATDRMTVGKPQWDGHIINFHWDVGNWNSQLFIPNYTSSSDVRSIQWRTQNNSTDWSGASEWISLLDTINHPATAPTADTTSTASPTAGGTFTTVDSVTRDASGHVTTLNTKTVTLPNDVNVDQTLNSENKYRPLLLANVEISNTTDETVNTTAIRNNSIYANTSSGYIIAKGFRTADSSSAGYLLADSVPKRFGGIFYNDNNLWIGTMGTDNYHHNGGTYISSGWTGTLPTTEGETLTGNDSIYVSIPTYTATDATTGTWGTTSYEVLHTGNTAASTLQTETVGGTGRPVYLSSGTITQCSVPSSGAWWNASYAKVPQISSISGVMEIGRYLDFHATAASTNNYDVRIQSTSTSRLEVDFAAPTGAALIPGTDNESYFGYSSKRWKYAYISSVLSTGENSRTGYFSANGISFGASTQGWSTGLTWLSNDRTSTLGAIGMWGSGDTPYHMYVGGTYSSPRLKVIQTPYDSTTGLIVPTLTVRDNFNTVDTVGIIDGALNSAFIANVDDNWASTPYLKLASLSDKTKSSYYKYIFLVACCCPAASQYTGILEISWNSSSIKGQIGEKKAVWLVADANIDTTKFHIIYTNDSDTDTFTIDIFVHQDAQWECPKFTLLQGERTSGGDINGWTFTRTRYASTTDSDPDNPQNAFADLPTHTGEFPQTVLSDVKLNNNTQTVLYELTSGPGGNVPNDLNTAITLSTTTFGVYKLLIIKYTSVTINSNTTIGETYDFIIPCDYVKSLSTSGNTYVAGSECGYTGLVSGMYLEVEYKTDSSIGLCLREGLNSAISDITTATLKILGVV